MKEQKYVIKNIDSFNLKHIFECGQCFRWKIETDNSYTGIVGKNVLNVRKTQDNIIIKGMCQDNLEDVCKDYFDLDTDYEKIKKKLSKIDNNMKQRIEFGYGIRILHQDIWETIISFIISANNNIPRIKKIIERISEKYGEKIIWNNKIYYTFPTVEELSKASVKDLRELGLGFRDVRVFETTRMIKNKEIDIQEIDKIQNVKELREKLLTLPGVGPKVADCIMLFSMKKYDVFPIDVWVKRVMNELYLEDILQCNKKLLNESDENIEFSTYEQINNKYILEVANNKFGNIAGLAQQYLFFWRREN